MAYDPDTDEYIEDPNPYYSPEKMGLVKIAEIDYSDGSYQFDTRVVWYHTESGVMYTARDSGCSCPTPFEDYTTLAKLETFNFNIIRAEVLEELAQEGAEITASQAQDFIYAIADRKCFPFIRTHPSWDEEEVT